MFDSLSVWSGIILVRTGFSHSDVPFGVLSTYGITWSCTSGIYDFTLPISVAGNFPFSWCNCWIFACLKILIISFAGCNCWVYSGYASIIGTIKGSALLNGYDWDAFFIWVISWFTCWSFSWYAPLTGTLGGTAGGVVSWIFPLGISITPCVHLIVWTVVLLVLDSVIQKLNPMRHELLHMWRTFMACWNVLGKTLLCLILLTLLFWGCITYGICSVPFMVLCNRYLLHVATMMLYCLSYCELTSLYLVGITVFVCNQIIQICGCRLIGGE